MPLKRETHAHQSTLARYCRTGVYEEIPGVDPERAAVYLRLVWGNVREGIEKAYPIAAASLSDDLWDEILHAFFDEHDANTPYYWKMPGELVDFVEACDFEARWGLPYLRDLLLFEWIEVELFMMGDVDRPAVKPAGNVMQEPLVLHPEGRIDRLRYPVYRTPVEELESQTGDYFLYSFRHPEELEARFMEISPICAVVIELLQQQPFSGEEIAQILMKQLGIESPDPIYRFTENFLSDLLQRGALLGVMEDVIDA